MLYLYLSTIIGKRKKELPHEQDSGTSQQFDSIVWTPVVLDSITQSHQGFHFFTGIFNYLPPISWPPLRLSVRGNYTFPHKTRTSLRFCHCIVLYIVATIHLPRKQELTHIFASLLTWHTTSPCHCGSWLVPNRDAREKSVLPFPYLCQSMLVGPSCRHLLPPSSLSSFFHLCGH